MTGPSFPRDDVLLTVEEMARADQATIAGGTPGEQLMEAAGGAVAAAVRDLGDKRPVAVLCGPGNNGGDGFVAARLLVDEGWPVRLALLGPADSLTGDAKTNAGRWQGEVEALSPTALGDTEIVVDAIFGAGLSREIDGVVTETVEAIGDRVCIAVDTPSGVHGNTGEVMGIAPKATTTVTFFRRKPGHLLLPGRTHCGEVRVADIGIPDSALDDIAPHQAENGPGLWLERYPWPAADAHKYSRGHAVVAGGAEMTGAARLAAKAALRVGAGIVSVAVPAEAAIIYRITLPGILVRSIRDTGMFGEVIEEERVTATLVGPGNEVNPATRERALAALRSGKGVVLDADALSAFEPTRDLLYSSIEGPCVLTPHEGEFRRLFDLTGDRLTRVREAAALCGAVVLLKGPDTVIAAPDGRAVINENAPPDLATAGAGDVLAGFVLGLLAQGMDPFDAACAGAWLHGAAAAEVGHGLIAEDLGDMLPAVLRKLAAEQK
ncbi:MAG: NAD(P)H-hydrate dehydratase [Alphaproteobacteria bacterium]|jgi:NAD(P)H-hydrate epimerase|nr:NAD(P)H-hydrate dehydratase [Alphaproteobacteria bacterium]